MRMKTVFKSSKMVKRNKKKFKIKIEIQRTHLNWIKKLPLNQISKVTLPE